MMATFSKLSQLYCYDLFTIILQKILKITMLDKVAHCPVRKNRIRTDIEDDTETKYNLNHNIQLSTTAG